MPLEIRRLTVKSVVRRDGPSSPEGGGPVDLDRFRQEVLEECRRIIADARRTEEER